MSMKEMQPQHGQPYGTVATDETILVEGVVVDRCNRQSEPAEAPARRKAILPELETYHWEDKYFDDSGHDIVAVFDHNAYDMSMGLCYFYLAFMVFAAPFVMAFFVTVFVTWITWRALFRWGVAPCPPSAICESIPAHTAVTEDGVLHVMPGNGDEYFFPFNSILAVNECTLTLVNNISLYSVRNEHKPEARNRAHQTDAHNSTSMSFIFLKNPVMFNKLLVAMKERNQRGNVLDKHLIDVATTLGMLAVNGTADEETKSVLLEIQAQLKRQNDLLEMSMPTGSIV